MINSPIFAEQKPFIPRLSFIKAEIKSPSLNGAGGIMKKIIYLQPNQVSLFENTPSRRVFIFFLTEKRI